MTDWDGYDTCYTERYMGTPANNPTGYRSSSVLHAVDRLKGDLLLIHGMLDENVHFRHTARLVTALIAAGKPFRMLPLPEERHSSRKEEGRQVRRPSNWPASSRRPSERTIELNPTPSQTPRSDERK